MVAACRSGKAVLQLTQADRAKLEDKLAKGLNAEDLDELLDLQPGTAAVFDAVGAGVQRAREQELCLREMAAENERQLYQHKREIISLKRHRTDSAGGSEATSVTSRASNSSSSNISSQIHPAPTSPEAPQTAQVAQASPGAPTALAESA